MSPWIRSFLLVTAVVAGLIVIIYFTSSTILLSGFANLEDQEIRRTVGRVQDALSSELADLDSSASDWAYWDDVYNFVQDPKPEWIALNLMDDTFTSLRLNMMTCVNAQGTVVYAKNVDLDKNQEALVPSSWLAQLDSTHPLLRLPNEQEGITGIVLLPQGPVMVAARAILTSERKGPAHGTLIFARFLDQSKIEQLEQVTHLSLTVLLPTDPQLPADVQKVRPNLQDQAIQVQALDQDSIAGYKLLNDVYGKPAAILRVTEPRAIYTEGQQSARLLLASLLAIGLVAAVTAQALITRLMRSQREQRESEDRYRTLAEGAQDAIFIVNRAGVIR